MCVLLMAGRSGRFAVIIKLQFSYACSYCITTLGVMIILVDSIKIDFILCVCVLKLTLARERATGVIYRAELIGVMGVVIRAVPNRTTPTRVLWGP